MYQGIEDYYFFLDLCFGKPFVFVLANSFATFFEGHFLFALLGLCSQIAMNCCCAFDFAGIGLSFVEVDPISPD